MFSKNVPLPIILLVVTDLSLIESECSNISTLQFVTLLFRHGNRTIERDTTYPTDPYINKSYYPYGLGELTNKGKRKAYALGKQIRKRYDSFLGPLYFPYLSETISTDMDRTKETALLVLAGLFPPANTLLEWDADLNWQPIPISYRPFGHDNHVLSYAFEYCPQYLEEVKLRQETEEAKTLNKKYEWLFEYMTKHTGENINTFTQVVDVYEILVSQEDFGLKLPPWTKQVYPDVIQRALGEYDTLITSTPKLKQLSGGFLLNKIMNDMQAKIENRLKPRGRKIILYSAHDITIIYLLGALNVYFPHQPPFSACVFIELHQIMGVYGIKIFYEDYTQPEPKLLTVPGCQQFCPLKRFITLLKSNIPTGKNPCNDSSPATF